MAVSVFIYIISRQMTIYIFLLSKRKHISSRPRRRGCPAGSSIMRIMCWYDAYISSGSNIYAYKNVNVKFTLPCLTMNIMHLIN